MKKIICILLVMVGFSAFAINPVHRTAQTKVVKATVKKQKPVASPMADMLLFPKYW